MVYTGRPSKACFACRGRRFKCDRKPKGCGQCARMGILCPLYPNPLEQGYRDQSEIVMEKAEASYKRKARRETMTMAHASSPSSLASSTACVVSGSDTLKSSLYHNPSLHLDTIAVTEFMASYVPQSPYDYLEAIYSEQDASLLVNVRAVSLAMTACKLKDPHVLAIARQLYATALSNTNTALRDLDTATKDSTLVSVLLLGLYEALVCQLSGKSSNWAKHTAGALALLQLRGEKQFTTQLGRRLFLQICAVLTFDAMVRRERLSPGLLDLLSTAKALGYESRVTTYVTLIGEITESPCVLWDYSMPLEDKVTKALWLDEKVLQFTKGLPMDFEYQELRQEPYDTPRSGWDTHGHTIHQYQHHHAARMWNACRVLRIKLNSVIHGSLSQSPSSASSSPEEWETALRRAKQNIGEAANDICASVPQILSPAEYDKVGIQASHEARVATLLPALSVTVAECLVPPILRSYAADRLKYLGRKFKVSQAESAATSGIGLDILHSGFHMLYVY